MKKLIISLIIFLVFFIDIKAQAPHSFKYQAIARDNKGEVITDKILGMRITILQGDIAGDEIYVETHQAGSNNFGLINLEIGKGVIISGDFSSIDWSSGPYFVKIEMDINGGDNYIILGTSQLLSVPYALYAEKAGNYKYIDTSCINLNCSPWIKNGDKIYYNEGNVGVGTSSPAYLLDIQGDADLSSLTPRQFIFLHNKNNSMHSNVALHFKSGTDMNEAAGSVGVAAYSYNGAPALEGYTYLYSNYSGIALRARNSEGIIKFITGGNEVINERMRITANGNIGIGTKEPSTMLEIVGKDLDNCIPFIIKNNASTAINLITAGNVDYYHGGFTMKRSRGTFDNPLDLLENDRVGGMYGRAFFNNDYWVTSSIEIYIGKDPGLDSYPSNIRFMTTSTGCTEREERMRISENGNIGIGTTDPKSKLHIKDGDIYINCLNNGIIMRSPDEQCWKVTVENDGSLVSSQVDCP